MNSLDLVKQYVLAVEQFDLAAAEPLMGEGMTFTELPNRIRPKGGTDDREAMLAGLAKAGERKMLSSQRYIWGETIETADRVVVEARWEGTMAMALGALQPGDTMVAHICMIFGISGGKIAWQRNYDCYEDFAAK